jgi:Cu/Ag efflux pump CusA
MEVFDALEATTTFPEVLTLKRPTKVIFQGRRQVGSVADIEAIVVKQTQGIRYVSVTGLRSGGTANRYVTITANGKGGNIQGQVMMLKNATPGSVQRRKGAGSRDSENLPEGVTITPSSIVAIWWPKQH